LDLELDENLLLESIAIEDKYGVTKVNGTFKKIVTQPLLDSLFRGRIYLNIMQLFKMLVTSSGPDL
jgi:hypothetical protein